jgi:hypothetical protein
VDGPDPFVVSMSLDRGPVRTVERDGVTWTVWEGHLGMLYDRHVGSHLFFESAAVVRRVRDFPADWATLPDGALMAVAERR